MKEIEIIAFGKSLVNESTIFQIEKVLNKYYENIEKVNNFHTMRDIIPIIYIFAETYEYIIDKKKWDKIIMRYMEMVKNQIVLEGYFNRLSLFDGMAEIGTAVYLLNKKTGYYSHFLESINNFILVNLVENIKVVTRNIDNLKMQHFDCISGISGIVSYLLHIKQMVDDEEVINSCISYLIKISNYRPFDKRELPAWHIKSKNQNREDEKLRFPQGNFNFSISHGIAGPLVALSLASANGINLREQKESIERILAEYKRLAIVKNDVVYWPGQYSYEDYLRNIRTYKNSIKRMSWCYGSIGILQAMKIGTKAIKDNELKHWVERNIHAISEMKTEDYGFTSPILCHGDSGLLALLIIELREKKSTVIQSKVQELADDVLNLYQPTNTYLFQMSDYKLVNGKYELVPIYSNSFLEGTAGIILSLVSAIKDTDWEIHLLAK